MPADGPLIGRKEIMLILGDQDPIPSELTVAHHIAGEMARSLDSLLILRGLGQPQVACISVRRTVNSAPAMQYVWQVYVPFKITERARAELHPSALRILCYDDDLVVVIASGNGAWEFKRVELSLALEKAKSVIPSL